MQANAVLEVKGLTKSFGSLSALRTVSFSVGTSEPCLLLGANGSGKSTLMRIIAGLTAQDAGTVAAPRPPIGYMAHLSGLYGLLSVKENLSFYRSCTNETRSIEEIIETWALNTFASQPAARLSRGQLAKASLARAFMGNPRLILLDEPSANLDDATVELLITQMSAATGSSIILLATHDTQRLSSACNNAIVLNQGEIGFESHGRDGVVRAIDYYRTVNR